MKTIYTIIDFFNIPPRNEPSECWVAHYSNRKDAIICFTQKLKECENIIDDKGEFINEDGTKYNTEHLFGELIGTGCSYICHRKSQIDIFFIRQEDIQECFDEKKTAW